MLQDVHWYGGGVGGSFQGYTLGNILSAQFYAAALKAHPEIPAEIGKGEFATLHGWLRENLYRHGRKFTPDELVKRATGGPMSIGPYIAYLRAKYGELYQLPDPRLLRGEGAGDARHATEQRLPLTLTLSHEAVGRRTGHPGQARG